MIEQWLHFYLRCKNTVFCVETFHSYIFSTIWHVCDHPMWMAFSFVLIPQIAYFWLLTIAGCVSEIRPEAHRWKNNTIFMTLTLVWVYPRPILSLSCHTTGTGNISVRRDVMGPMGAINCSTSDPCIIVFAYRWIV